MPTEILRHAPPRSRAGSSRAGSSRAGSSRAGFTLIELLITITIIAILASFTLRVVGGVLTSAKIAATKTTIKKINEQLENRLKGFNQQETYSYPQYDPVIDIPLEKYALMNSDGTTFRDPSQATPIDGERLLVLRKKCFYRRYFPQTWREVAAWEAVPDLTTPGNWTLTVPEGGTIANFAGGGKLITDWDWDPSNPNFTQSAEVLYYIVTQGATAGVDAVGRDAFSATEVKDTDGNGFPEFVDAWGNPLRFYRWPTQLISYTNPLNTQAQNERVARILLPNLPQYANLPFNPQTIGQNPIPSGPGDPDDPFGLLTLYDSSPTPWSCSWTCSLSNFTAIPPYQANFQGFYHDPKFMHPLLIVSAGPQGTLGLYEPHDYTDRGNLAAVKNASDLVDNISNHQIRAGGN